MSVAWSNICHIAAHGWTYEWSHEWKWTWKHLMWCGRTWADNKRNLVQFCTLNPHAILLLSSLALVQWTGLVRTKTKHSYPGSQVICSRQMFYLKTQSNTTGSFQKGWQAILRQSPIKYQLHSDEMKKSIHVVTKSVILIPTNLFKFSALLHSSLK